eukprot:6473444-Amphidinium_carterae.1
MRRRSLLGEEAYYRAHAPVAIVMRIFFVQINKYNIYLSDIAGVFFIAGVSHDSSRQSYRKTRRWLLK